MEQQLGASLQAWKSMQLNMLEMMNRFAWVSPTGSAERRTEHFDWRALG